MMIRLTRSFAAAAVAATLAAPCAAQTLVYSTLPASSTSQTVFSLNSASNWAASSFVFGGATGSTLASIDVAFQELFIQGFTAQLNITFLTDLSGTTMQNATALETWHVPVTPNSPAATYPFAATSTVSLVNGQTYWLELSTAGYGWNWFNGPTSITNAITSQSTDGGTTWKDSGPGGSPAFDVYVNTPSTTLSTVTPEPATMSLLALGLVGIAGVRRRKQSR